MGVAISNIKVKRPGLYTNIQITCPDCNHSNIFIILLKDRDKGDEEQECSNCHALIGFHWEKRE